MLNLSDIIREYIISIVSVLTNREELNTILKQECGSLLPFNDLKLDKN